MWKICNHATYETLQQVAIAAAAPVRRARKFSTQRFNGGFIIYLRIHFAWTQRISNYNRQMQREESLEDSEKERGMDVEMEKEKWALRRSLYKGLC